MWGLDVCGLIEVCASSSTKLLKPSLGSPKLQGVLSSVASGPKDPTSPCQELLWFHQTNVILAPNVTCKKKVNTVTWIYLPLHLYPCLIMPQSCNKRQRDVRESEEKSGTKTRPQRRKSWEAWWLVEHKQDVAAPDTLPVRWKSPPPDRSSWADNRNSASLFCLGAKWEQKWETDVGAFIGL